MTFAKINLTGWSYEDVLTSPQINQFQDNMVDSIDGIGGGTYANIAPIFITGTFEVGDLIVDGSTTINGDIIFLNNTVQFTGSTVQFDGDSDLEMDHGSTATFRGNVTLGDASGDVITINGTATFNNNVNANFVEMITLSVLGDTTLGNNASDDLTIVATTVFSSPVTINSSLNMSGALVTTGDVTLGDASGDVITINGTATFNNNVNANFVEMITLSVLGDTTLGNNASDDLTIVATTVFSSPVYADTIACNSIQVTSILGSPILTGLLVANGNGSVTDKPFLTPDSDTTISVRQYNTLIATSAITGERSYTIDSTGCVDGCWFSHQNLDATYDQILIIANIYSGSPNVHIPPFKFVKYVMSGGLFYPALAT